MLRSLRIGTSALHQGPQKATLLDMVPQFLGAIDNRGNTQFRFSEPPSVLGKLTKALLSMVKLRQGTLRNR